MQLEHGTGGADRAAVFYEDFSDGVSDAKWMFVNKVWGLGNCGVDPRLAKIEKDVVDGVEKNVLVVGAIGDEYAGTAKFGFPCRGSKRRCSDNTRVGSVIRTRRFFGSGIFEIEARIGDHSEVAKKTDCAKGLCIAFWTFHYEEHYDGKDDPQFSPFNCYKPKDDTAYTVINSEIDVIELGKAGNVNDVMCTTYEYEHKHSSNHYPLPPGVDLADGKYHKFKAVWRTHLVPSQCLEVKAGRGNDGIYCVKSPNQDEIGRPVVQDAVSGEYLMPRGKVVETYIDGVKVGENVEEVPCVAAPLNLGVWMPFWVGPAPWSRSEAVKISSLKITPLCDAGDVFCQRSEASPCPSHNGTLPRDYVETRPAPKGYAWPSLFRATLYGNAEPGDADKGKSTAAE